MNYFKNSNKIQFYSIGISYKKTDASIRGLFSISEENQNLLLEKGKRLGCSNLLLISTCNRTELYAFTQNPQILLDLILEFSLGTQALLKENSFVFHGQAAVQHLFEVGCGLDSQILGDFEIIGQVKKSYEQSLKHKTAHIFLDRLVNSVIQSSRRVKAQTQLSSGATSVSYAGVQYIKDQFINLSEKKILLFGTGKLGRNTCENLLKHTNHESITLINRSSEKANILGAKFDVKVKPLHSLSEEISKTDIMFVATGAQTPTIEAHHIKREKPLLILDLSIPRNVNQNIVHLPGVTLLHMDELTELTNKTLENRQEHLPKAIQVMNEIKNEFFEWVESRQMVPTITALQSKLKGYKDHELQKMVTEKEFVDPDMVMEITDKVVQKLTGKFAGYIRQNSDNMEKDLEFIQQVFKLDDNLINHE